MSDESEAKSAQGKIGVETIAPEHQQRLPRRKREVVPLLQASLIASLVFTSAWIRSPFSRISLIKIAEIFFGYGILITVSSMVIGIPAVRLLAKFQMVRWWVYGLVGATAGAALGALLSSHPSSTDEIQNPFAIAFSPWTRSAPGFAGQTPPISWADYVGSILFGAIVGGSLGIAFWCFHSRDRHRERFRMSSQSFISPTAAEFQRRRTQTWRFIRWWLVVAAGLMGYLIVFLLTKRLDESNVGTGVALALVILTALVGAGLTVLRIYRCPNCNKVPAGDMGEVDEGGKVRIEIMSNPRSCPNCRARLR